MYEKAFPKLRIYHFISGDLWAGAETMAYNLLRRLKEYEDLDLYVILLNEGRLADELRSLGTAVHIIDEKQYSLPMILQKINKIAATSPPDIIHSHRYKENFLALLISLYSRRIKLVATQHGLPEYHARKTGIKQWLIIRMNFLVLSWFFNTVAVSEDIRDVLVKRLGFRNNMVEVVRNGIELPVHPAAMRNTGQFVIGSSGRLFPVKDYPLMIEIARSVKTTGARDIRFELAGDGPELPALESLVQRYALDAEFIFKGHQDDMASFYRGLNVYLNTSVHEGIPMTILEALSHGLPVIAPAVGGIVEIIDDGKEGFLVNSRNPHDFADKCLVLKNNKEIWENNSRAARKKAELAFSAEQMAESYYRFYRKISAATQPLSKPETAASNQTP